MNDRIIKIIPDAGGARRVIVVQHADGTYGWWEEVVSSEPEENCWLVAYRQMESVCDSAETAEREARGRIEWLAQK